MSKFWRNSAAWEGEMIGFLSAENCTFNVMANYLAKKTYFTWVFSRIATTQKNLHKVSALLEHTPLKIAHTTLEYRVITYA